MLAFSLERAAQQPIYHQIKRHLLNQITTGLLAPGDKLPATRDLADQLGVARISVVAAYEELKAEGVLTAHVGRGTFVAEQDEHSLHLGTASLPTVRQGQSAALRDLLRLAVRPGVIDFSQGTPAEDFLPVNMIREAINRVLTRDGAAAVAYESPEGYRPLRVIIAGHLVEQGVETRAEDVLITGGCQQALDLGVQALMNPGDVLLTTNPTYAGILDIAQARGMNVIGVPVDENGMNTDLLESLIVEHRPRLMYIAPTYHNPTGTVMPLQRRSHLLTLAAYYKLPILEDAVYEDLTYTGAPPPSLKALDEADLVLYASSFSKVFLPGMRIGYLIVGKRLHERLARVKHAADVCTPALNQRAIHAVLESGDLWTHLAQVQSACQMRRTAMLGALKRYFPDAVWNEPAGGLYVWVELPPDGPTATELYLQSIEAGAGFAMGPLFHTDGQGAHHLRLNLAAHPPERIEEGIRRIGNAWRDLAAGYSGTSRQQGSLL